MTHRLVRKAQKFATAAHASVNQRRKYTGEPYIVHPFRVAAIVATVDPRPEVLAAAYLHDVVEDTPVTLAEISDQFGQVVADLVGELTDISTPADGNRDQRKALDRAHSAAGSPASQTIKLADMIDNSETITKHDRKFAAVYMKEKRNLLEVMLNGNQALYERAWDLVIKWEQNKP